MKTNFIENINNYVLIAELEHCCKILQLIQHDSFREHCYEVYMINYMLAHFAYVFYIKYSVESENSMN